MFSKNFLLTLLIAFFFMYGFDFIWHAHVMREMYQNTAALWRTEAEMEVFFMHTTLISLFMALLMIYGFRNFSGNFDVKSGIKFGAFLGVVIGLVEFMMYFYMPLPLMIAVFWFVGSIVKFTLLGGILGWSLNHQ